MNKIIILSVLIALAMGEKLIFEDEFEKLDMKTW
jgi:hypothetical protein